jgi:hypothetical protein
MVKQNKVNIRKHSSNQDNLSKLVKSADSYEDELIKSLSEKRENRRAKQTWEWEQVRRNSIIMRDTA